MSLELDIKEEADMDLDEEAIGIARHRPDIARRFFDAAQAAFSRLAEYPYLGSAAQYHDPRLEGLRRWPVPGYEDRVVIYRVTPDTVEILRMLHGARDIERLPEYTF